MSSDFFALLLLVPPWLAACSPQARAGVAPGVLLIAVDGLRADHLALYGYDRDTSPTLSALARDGVRFEQVFASAPLLIPAHVALLTGCEPSQSRRYLPPEFEGLSERRWLVPEALPRPAIEFLAAGYATAAFVESELLSEAFGFDRGFQHYELLDPKGAQAWEGPQDERVVDHLLQWLRALAPTQPWFAYLELHQLERCWSVAGAAQEGYFQPRAELSQVPPVANTDSVFFAVPRSRWRGGVRSLGQYEAVYDDQIRGLDGEIGRLGALLRRLGRDEATTLHVVGAFGMQLGEAGLYLCSGRYSLADLGVPWIVRPRANLTTLRGASLPGLISTLDVAPTVLALEGLSVPSGTHGHSQVEAMRLGVAHGERPYVFASCGLQEGCAVIGERHVLEYLFPFTANDAEQRRSWTGTWSEQTKQTRLYFYDRLSTPFPMLAEGRLEHDAEAVPFRSAAVDWLRDMNDLRLYLQNPQGGPHLDESVVQRLREKGYAAGPR